ncbi:hypothetical protein ACLB2K_021312 [Fragaria x ananassa]
MSFLLNMDGLSTVVPILPWFAIPSPDILISEHGPESELVEDIGKFVWSKVIQVEVDSTMSAGDFEAFRATRKAREQVTKALKNDKVNVIGVYGKGVGKTTMVKHASAEAQKDSLFNHVVEVSVSQSPDLRKIRGKFADILGLKFQDETDVQKAIRLMKFLSFSFV